MMLAGEQTKGVTFRTEQNAELYSSEFLKAERMLSRSSFASLPKRFTISQYIFIAI